MTSRIIRGALGFASLLILTACALQPAPAPTASWTYSDLRGMDTADAPQPTLDLLALYTRTEGEELQIRLDLLDHAATPDFDLYLAIDDRPGGAQDLPIEAKPGLDWDTLLIIPASGPLQVLDSRLRPQRDSALRVVRDPLLDTITLNIKQAALSDAPSYLESQRASASGRGLGLQAFLTAPGSKEYADQLGPVSSDTPRPEPARVLFAFWNTYPAYSPVTALRRWDGAHTGPQGGRHGLYNLLRAANSSSTPVFLLDLKNPASLSALDYGGQGAIVDEMLDSGLLALPDPLPDEANSPIPLPEWAERRVLTQNREAARHFGLGSSPFLYAPSGKIPSGSNARFTFTREAASGEQSTTFHPVVASRWREQMLLPIPDYAEKLEQATVLGPSLEVRRALVQTALAAGNSEKDGTPLLLLGGDLPASAWGNPQAARETLRYLAAHPWVKFLNANDLQVLQPSTIPSQQVPTSQATPGDELLTALRQSPDNNASLAAWQSFLALYAPIAPPASQLPELRTHYTGQVWGLLEAAQWAAKPADQARCDMDPDHDGQAECILASDNVFALVEQDSGALVFAFARLPGKTAVHQLTGPSSQFITGLSDPSTWNEDGGEQADPAVIYGAFGEPGSGYTGTGEAGGLVLTSADGQRRKTYRLTPNGLRLEYQGTPANSHETLRLPLALDPWLRFRPGWADGAQQSTSPEVWTWQVDPELKAVVQASTPFKAHTFLDSRAFFAQTEDPNQDYPSGHFLVFPLAVVDFTGRENFYVEVSLLPTGE